MEPAFIVVDEDRRRDVHCIHKHQPLNHATIPQTLLNPAA
jgi:hypothetical protein